MAIESNLKTFSVEWLVNQREEGLLNTDIAIQRQLVWNHELQSNLIVTVLRGAPIPSLWFEKNGEGFNVIDGKQRTLSLCSYVSDGFALSPQMLYKDADGKPVVGKKFSNLDKVYQRRIMNYQLSITVLDELEDGDRDFVFYMGNQGKPLTKTELLPTVLGENITERLEVLCKHPFMQHKAKLTSIALRRRDDMKIIIQYLVLRLGRKSGFAGNELFSLCDDIRAGLESIPFDEIKALLDYLDDAFDGSRSYLQRAANLSPILHVACRAMNGGVAANVFGEAIDNFFEESGDEFKRVGIRANTKRESVRERIDMLSNACAGIFGVKIIQL